MDHRTSELLDAFQRTYGASPRHAARAPGRVNLIGEHTDYNEGFCLPMAIELDVRVAFTPRTDNTVSVISLQQQGMVKFELGRAIPKAERKEDRWTDYVKGC